MDIIRDIDSAENGKDAEKKRKFWASKITNLGAEKIAGASIRRVNKNDWRVDLFLYVDRNSSEFKDFMRRFR